MVQCAYEHSYSCDTVRDHKYKFRELSAGAASQQLAIKPRPGASSGRQSTRESCKCQQVSRKASAITAAVYLLLVRPTRLVGLTSLADFPTALPPPL
eukprot:scaffold163427_cov17-Prasinocladus_malaysianus.AAC.1